MSGVKPQKDDEVSIEEEESQETEYPPSNYDSIIARPEIPAHIRNDPKKYFDFMTKLHQHNA